MKENRNKYDFQRKCLKFWSNLKIISIIVFLIAYYTFSMYLFWLVPLINRLQAKLHFNIYGMLLIALRWKCNVLNKLIWKVIIICELKLEHASKIDWHKEINTWLRREQVVSYPHHNHLKFVFMWISFHLKFVFIWSNFDWNVGIEILIINQFIIAFQQNARYFCVLAICLAAQRLYYDFKRTQGKCLHTYVCLSEHI